MAAHDHRSMQSATNMPSNTSFSNQDVNIHHLSAVSSLSRVSRSDILSLATPRRQRAAGGTVAWIKSATECLITNAHHYKAQRRLTKRRRASVKTSQLNMDSHFPTNHGPIFQKSVLHATALNLQKLASCSNQALSSNPVTPADLETACTNEDKAKRIKSLAAEKRRGRIFSPAEIVSWGKTLDESSVHHNSSTDIAANWEPKIRANNPREFHGLDLESTIEGPKNRDSYWEHHSREYQAEITRLNEYADTLNRELTMLREVSQHNKRFHGYYKKKYETAAHQLEGTMQALRLIHNVGSRSPRSDRFVSEDYQESPATEFDPSVLPHEDKHS